MKSTYAFAAAAALFLCTAPFSIAQTAAPPTTPPTASAPPAPAQPATPADPSATSAPADPTPPEAAAPPSMGDTANTASNTSCRTRKAEGERCSCLSAPTDFGTAQTQNGHSVCVVPKS